MKTYKTKPKEYIIEFLKSHKNKSYMAKDIYNEIIKIDENINLSTIYRNIDKLVMDGILLKHQSKNSLIYTYQYIENEECLAHFHFECIKCGKVSHLGAKETNDFLKMVKLKMQFDINSENTYFSGICNNCKKIFLNI